MKYLGPNGLQYFYDKYIRPMKDAAYKYVANNLTTEEEGGVLDARQGKKLDEKKIDKDNIANNLTTEEEGNVLDARQGKVIDEKIKELTEGKYEYYGEGLDHCIRFPDAKLQICFGTMTITAELKQNGNGYTGTANPNHEFIKPFSQLFSTEVGNADADWFWIINKTSSETAIKTIVLGYFQEYEEQEFYVDYIAIGKYVN